MNNGFQIINQQLWIAKDPEARLIYTFDWGDWLSGADTITTADYTVTARVNDPAPLVKITSGISGNKTYITLSAGQIGKSYTVAVKVTTANGLIDNRNFKVRVEQRSA
jgi:hypothetical protein